MAQPTEKAKALKTKAPDRWQTEYLDGSFPEPSSPLPLSRKTGNKYPQRE
ncbi:hypothetical protein K9N68_24095 [Kovacikia minuta CCNUW1]|nr:hypothetical protein [Kovacikia minuta]UBF24726.1 hypothetical protein K9N68_24095 [Kovacikia minuta CCNUW1]